MATNFRFATSTPDQSHIGASWNFRVQGNDCYLFHRSTSYVMKLSLHMYDGNCHLKHEPAYRQHSQAGDGYIMKWKSKSNSGFAEPLVISTPIVAMNKPIESLPTGKKIAIVPASIEHPALNIRVIVTEPGTQWNADHTIFEAQLANGHTALLVPHYGNPVNITLPTQNPAVHYLDDHSVESLSQGFADGDDMRILLFGDQGPTGLILETTVGLSGDGP